MIVKWEVDDGYVGKSAPHETEIDDDTVKDCDTLEEAMVVITAEVEEDFSDKISWYFPKEEEIKGLVSELLKMEED